jgi:hypothetical protein
VPARNGRSARSASGWVRAAAPYRARSGGERRDVDGAGAVVIALAVTRIITTFVEKYLSIPQQSFFPFSLFSPTAFPVRHCRR